MYYSCARNSFGWLIITWWEVLGYACIHTFVAVPPGSGDSYEKYFDHLCRFPVHALKHLKEYLICFERPALRMPCDHPVCSTCLMNYVWTEVGCNKKTEIRCSLCTSEWPLHIIQDYANVLSKEKKLLQESLSTNCIVSDPTISECPGCDNYCEREDKTTNRVYCHICRNLAIPTRTVGTVVGLETIVDVICNKV